MQLLGSMSYRPDASTCPLINRIKAMTTGLSNVNCTKHNCI